MRLALSLLSLASLASLAAAANQAPIIHPDNDYLLALAEQAGPRVNVSLFVMSRCPDARMCETVFDDVFKHDGMLAKVQLEMNYIGEINNDAPYGAECMHGPPECAGNAHQLCMQAYLPTSTFSAALACMNYGNFPSGIGSTSLARRCVEAQKVDWWESGIGRCVQGDKGWRVARTAKLAGVAEKKLAAMTDAALDEWEEYDGAAAGGELEPLGKEGRRRLRAAIQRTVNAGVKKSCTIRIASTVKHGARECVVDGGVWKGCDDGHTPADFVRVIKEEWEALRELDEVPVENSWPIKDAALQTVTKTVRETVTVVQTVMITPPAVTVTVLG